MKVLIDSDILIEVGRNRDLDIVTAWNSLSSSATILLCSPINVAELWSGALPREFEKLEKLFSLFQIVPADHAVGRLAGDIMRTFRKSHNLEVADAIIAASAIQSGAQLWTRNRKHYPSARQEFFQPKR